MLFLILFVQTYYFCVYHVIVLLVACLFFFFKQKTAYEMRISDWSSDVCSSDLQRPRDRQGCHAPQGPLRHLPAARRGRGRRQAEARLAAQGAGAGRGRSRQGSRSPRAAARDRVAPRRRQADHRSEEHTSELQSLMRSSYAVFCLQKKNITLLKHHKT